MIHYQQAITNTKGDALIGYFVKLANTSDDSTISLYADSSLTPIVSVSGVDNACLVDSNGMADFWVNDVTAHMDIYATDGVTLVRRETFVQFGVPDADYGDVSVASGVWTVEAVNGAALGTMSSQNATAVAITGGSVTGITDLAVADGGTGASDAATARVNLGLTNVITDSTTARTAALTDSFAFIRFTNASAVTFTIPPNSSVAFPTGTVIEFSQSGAGAVSVAAGVGVTVNSRAADLTLAGQYSVAFVRKVDTDTWIMNGDL